MRIYATSDIHIDYTENKDWFSSISSIDYLDDILILAGDVSDKLTLLEKCFDSIAKKFSKVMYVPGNHELWVSRDKSINSIEKYNKIISATEKFGVETKPVHIGGLSIVPLLSWYDFSFGDPCEKLLEVWMDFRACAWPDEFTESDITNYFLEINARHLQISNEVIISFSHFLPRLDLMPSYISSAYHYIYPVLGSHLLDKQIRALKSDIHVYGHSHVNRDITLEGVRYLNNAFAYPRENNISSKRLLKIFEL